MRPGRPKCVSLLLACLLAAAAFASGCKDDAPPPDAAILTPELGAVIDSCEGVEVRFEFVDELFQGPLVFLDGVEIDVELEEVSPGEFTFTLGPEFARVGERVLRVWGMRRSDGDVRIANTSFTWNRNAKAYVIGSSTRLIEGPLAHNRPGDFMLEGCVARFVVQAGGQRDLYSVGQYGGNLIDAELIDRPGLDNFLEVQNMVNVETVVNAQDVFIVNDGSDGQPAVVRACGPDDLLDFVNPSSQVNDIPGLDFPANLNDNDQTVEGCTDYALSVDDTHVAMTTTFTNTGTEEITLLSGDWMNSAGELDTLGVPNAGVGPALFNELGVLGFFGFDEARGVDYAYTSTPTNPGSYVVISGVTVILHETNVLEALLTGMGGVDVAPGGTYTIERFFGVGDGSGSNAVDLVHAVKGTPVGRVSGCVTVAGVPAPGAVVTIGTFDGTDAITALSTSFVTDEAGCYDGSVATPASPTPLGAVAAREGTLYQGGGVVPNVTRFNLSTGQSTQLDFDLPETGALTVTSRNADGVPLPTRVSVVGFDPSPPIVLAGPSLPGFGSSELGLFLDPDDAHPFGIVDAVYTGADGEVSIDLEPGSYWVVVSRGTEYSIYEESITIVAGAEATVDAQLALVLDTAGFVSSDFHIHGINSADSRVSHVKRVEGYAGEGVDNIIMTDHHVHTDLDPTIKAEGLGDWVSSTVGEEITTFDYGHFNAYPFTVDASVPSGGSTDWAVAAEPGQDFPTSGAFNATPAEIFNLARNNSTATPDTTVQINHIGSHFGPLRIDTTLEPPRDDLDATGRSERRLGAPPSENLFYPFPALELWNGHTRGAQSAFLDDRIGIWFNLLNQGLRTTFIADTDTHRHETLRQAGARTWTAAAPGSDAAGSVDDGEVARMVDAGKATGGQGVFVTTRLIAQDGSTTEASLTHDGTTTLSNSGSAVDLAVRVQAPVWSAFDTIEIYANAATSVVDPEAPYAYGAIPTQILSEGDCDPTTTGDGDFDVTIVDVAPAVAGAQRLEATVTVPFPALTEDTWFVAVVKASDGVCPPLFPVYPANLDSGSNTTLADLMDGNVGESGVMALGATNALYFEVDGL